MSASILRTSLRRNVAISNKRFYSSETPAKPGSGNSGILLGIAAVGAGYYLYKRSTEINKNSNEKYEEAKDYISNKADEAKGRYEQEKANAGAKIEGLKKDAVSKYEAAKDATAQKDIDDDVEKAIKKKT